MLRSILRLDGLRLHPPRQARPNRVHLCYGLVIRLRLLSTFPHGNAVTTFDYRPVTSGLEGTSTLLIKRLHRRTSPRVHAAGGSPG